MLGGRGVKNDGITAIVVEFNSVATKMRNCSYGVIEGQCCELLQSAKWLYLVLVLLYD